MRIYIMGPFWQQIGLVLHELRLIPGGLQPISLGVSTATHCKTLQHPATHCNTLQHTATHFSTAYDSWGDIFECCFKAQSSKLKRLFATFQWKETFELWALSFERAFENVIKDGIGCTYIYIYIYIHINIYMFSVYSVLCAMYMNIYKIGLF